MTHPLWWLHFVAAFLGVIALLVVAAAIHEWWLWKKDKQ